MCHDCPMSILSVASEGELWLCSSMCVWGVAVSVLTFQTQGLVSGKSSTHIVGVLHFHGAGWHQCFIHACGSAVGDLTYPTASDFQKKGKRKRSLPPCNLRDLSSFSPIFLLALTHFHQLLLLYLFLLHHFPFFLFLIYPLSSSPTSSTSSVSL